MREGWNYKRLIEVCDFQGGSQPPKEEWSKEPKPNYVRMLQIRDFTQSATDYIEFVKVSKSLKYCQDDDILLGRYGASVGKVLTGLSGAYNVAIIKAIPNVALVSKKYIKSYFLSPGFQLNLGKVSQHRAAQAGFSKDDIAGFPIPIPPIQEQEKIVAELDCLTGIIEKKTQQLEELDKLARSIFYDMFGDPITNEKGWEMKKLGDEFGIASGGTPSTKENSYWENGTISWIGSNMCHNEVIYENDGKFITEAGLNNSSARLFRKGFVLVALVGATIGKVALIQFETTTNQNIAGIDVPANKCYTSFFVFYLIQCLYCLFESIGEGKFKMANLSFVRSLPLIAPPIDLQNEFSEKIEAIEKQKELVKRSIVETETLFNSRMDFWFNN